MTPVLACLMGTRHAVPRRVNDAYAEVDPSDWRPRDHEFTGQEMRDRFMRYGGVDAATAWHMVAFVRSEQRLDFGAVLDASDLILGSVN